MQQQQRRSQISKHGQKQNRPERGRRWSGRCCWTRIAPRRRSWAAARSRDRTTRCGWNRWWVVLSTWSHPPASKRCKTTSLTSVRLRPSIFQKGVVCLCATTTTTIREQGDSHCCEIVHRKTYLTESCSVLQMNISAFVTTGSLVGINWVLKIKQLRVSCTAQLCCSFREESFSLRHLTLCNSGNDVYFSNTKGNRATARPRGSSLQTSAKRFHGTMQLTWRKTLWYSCRPQLWRSPFGTCQWTAKICPATQSENLSCEDASAVWTFTKLHDKM